MTSFMTIFTLQNQFAVVRVREITKQEINRLTNVKQTKLLNK